MKQKRERAKKVASVILFYTTREPGAAHSGRIISGAREEKLTPRLSFFFSSFFVLLLLCQGVRLGRQTKYQTSGRIELWLHQRRGAGAGGVNKQTNK